MGDYSYGEHLELFGGPPEPGEAYPDLEQVDLARKAAKEDPGPFEPGRCGAADCPCNDGDPCNYEDHTDDAGVTTEAMPLPEPRCVVCDRETHTHEQLQACRSMLKRTDTAEIEEWRG